MNERIKVVLLEPDKEAQIAEIETTLESIDLLVNMTENRYLPSLLPFRSFQE